LPDPAEVAALLPLAEDPARFRRVYERGADTALWAALDSPTGPRYAWDPQSSYLIEPPFFGSVSAPVAVERARIEHPESWTEALADQVLAQPVGARADRDRIDSARALVLLGDSVTTDHISPGGEIPLESAAGRYLVSLGVRQADFNSYVGRRGNYRVMSRAAFANLRLRNLLVPGTEGGQTLHHPSAAVMSIFEAAMRYRAAGVHTLVLAGRDYGSGSSRDWAAKCTLLLGVAAVIAESFERIHRANLIAMGVMPLLFEAGQGWGSLGLTGHEHFTLHGIDSAIETGSAVSVSALATDGRTIEFMVRPALLTRAERNLMQGGGIPGRVLRLLGAAPETRSAEAQRLGGR
jgi:aconitate hydratase